MNKKEKLNLIKELAYKKDYEILAGTHEFPSHIRINDICDIWSNGTLKIHGKHGFIKGDKGLNRFAQLMGDEKTPDSIKKSMRAEIDSLKQIVEKQEAAISNLFNRLEEVEFLVNAPASAKSV
jgi:hypothetical protein